MRKIFSLLVSSFVVLTFFACQNNKVNVVTSSYLTHSIVEQLTKNTKITVSTARAPYLNIHNSELTLKDKSKIVQSDLLIYFSNSVDVQIKKARGSQDALNLEKALNVTEDSFFDNQNNLSKEEKNIRRHAASHYWSSLKYINLIIEKIADKLIEKFLEYKTKIHENKIALVKKINEISADLKEFIKVNFSTGLNDEKILFCGHDSIGAFMIEMGLLKGYTPIDTTIQDRNEDTIKAINEFVELIKIGTKNKAKTLTVFVQEIGKEQVLEKLKSSCQELNIRNVSFKTFHTFHAVTKEEYTQKIPFQTKISENIANLKLSLLGK